MEGKVARSPGRFEIETIKCRDIGPFKTSQPDAPAKDPSKSPTSQPSGFSEDAPVFSHKSARHKDRSHLRLVKDESVES